jgi:hypothetical protein
MIGAGGEIISDVIRQTRGRREMWPVACGLWRRQTTQAGCVCACRGAERSQRTVSLVSEGGQRLGGRPIGD